MEIRYPNYYKKCHWIAGDCPDACCAGWEIPVDKVSERRYCQERKSGNIQNQDFARKLKKYVKIRFLHMEYYQYVLIQLPPYSDRI